MKLFTGVFTVFIIGWAAYWLFHGLRERSVRKPRKKCAGCPYACCYADTQSEKELEILAQKGVGVVPEDTAAFFRGEGKPVKPFEFVAVLPHGRVGAEEDVVGSVLPDDPDGFLGGEEHQTAAGIQINTGMTGQLTGVFPDPVSAQMSGNDGQTWETLENPQQTPGIGKIVTVVSSVK